MKKYFIGMLALVLAIGFSAFTKPQKPAFAEDRVFEFDGTGAYQNSTNIADKTHWLYIGTLEEVGVCDEFSEAKACRLIIDHAKLTTANPSLGQTLDAVSTGFTIAPQQISSPYFRVLSVSKTSPAYSGAVSNQIP